MIEVEFEEDPQVLLGYIQKNAKMDGTLSISDGQLIDALGWRETGSELRLYSAKSKLQMTGMIRIFRDLANFQILQLTGLGFTRSDRYVLMVVPLALWPNFSKQIVAYRKPAKMPPAPRPKHRNPSPQAKVVRAMKNLGVKPKIGPIRPPIKQPK